MLTAIGDFVQDSVGRASGATLASADVGEHLLWVEDGPRARLACFIRGAPPAALRTLLRQRLEQIHARFADPLAQLQAGAADVGAALDRALDLPGLERAARAVDDAPPPARARWPALLLALLVVGALLAWGVHQWRWSQRVAAVAATLSDWPGLALQGIAREGGGLRVRALLDPLADPPQPAVAALLPADAPLVFDTRGYLATDAAIVERRARAVLALPAGATLEFAGGVLRLAGELPDAERAALLARAALVPGVDVVDGGALLAREVRLRAELDALRTQVEARRIAFDGDAETPPDPAAATPLVDDLRRLLALAADLGVRPRLRTRGGTDDSGTPARNATLRAARASWLAGAIAAALAVEVEIEVGVVAGDADSAATLEGRSAAVVVDLGEDQRR